MKIQDLIDKYANKKENIFVKWEGVRRTYPNEMIPALIGEEIDPEI